MIKLKLRKIRINGRQFGYWSNETKNSRRTCLLLSPGAYSGKFFRNYEKYFSDRDLFICPDFPARGFSELQEDNSISGITKTIDKFICELGLTNTYLVGFSYGTQIATELLKINEERFRSVILVASGEFFNKLSRVILKVIFIPFLFSDTLRYKIKKYVLKYIFVPNKILGK
jgi:pimeloyl-ACP methyl ester carboxylesterase